MNKKCVMHGRIPPCIAQRVVRCVMHGEFILHSTWGKAKENRLETSGKVKEHLLETYGKVMEHLLETYGKVMET